jgi:type 1 fimbriae regulatory protein FimB/type 1 fimbriae regulatory protein FimE
MQATAPANNTTSTPSPLDPRGIAPRCPECGSERLYRDGFRYLTNGENVQRWLCRDCGYRFSEMRKSYNNLSDKYRSDAHGKKVLVMEVERAEEKSGQAGATQQTAQQADVKGAIVNFVWKLKKEGYSEATITDYSYILKLLAQKGADLFNPESVKEVIAKQETWSVRKWQAVKAYSAFARLFGLSWTPPRYKPVQKLPFIPTEEEIDQLIGGCGSQMATFLQLLKETGMRCGEAFNLKWTDIDLVKNMVRVTPEKSSNPRIFKISNNLASMLVNLPKNSMKVFTYKDKFYLRKVFLKMRKRVAFKVGNPRILQIHFHTLRHWKATMEYHKTKDILHVMQLLGHKNIKNTLIYTQLINFNENEYVCRVAKTLEEATQLIEAGFEYVTDVDGCKLFRKRK